MLEGLGVDVRTIFCLHRSGADLFSGAHRNPCGTCDSLGTYRPFDRESALRVALRPSQTVAGQTRPKIEVGTLKLDRSARVVSKHGKEVHVTPSEYNVLVASLKDAGKVSTPKQLLTDVGGAAYSKGTHYLRVVIKDHPTQPPLL